MIDYAWVLWSLPHIACNHDAGKCAKRNQQAAALVVVVCAVCAETTSHKETQNMLSIHSLSSVLSPCFPQQTISPPKSSSSHFTGVLQSTHIPVDVLQSPSSPTHVLQSLQQWDY